MGTRTWILHIAVTAQVDSAAADLDMEEIVGDHHGPAPLRRLATHLENWSEMEIDSVLMIAQPASDS